MIRNPPLFVLLVLFTLVNIVDSITATFKLPGETNPLYLLSGSIWIIIALKLMVIGGAIYFWWRNKFPGHFTYYSMILFLLLGTLLISLGVVSNMLAINDPNYLEEVSSISTQEKIQQYGLVVSIFYFLPVIFSLVSFKIYQWSLNYIEIDKKYFKKRLWWKI